jgi:hypothetical protein
MNFKKLIYKDFHQKKTRQFIRYSFEELKIEDIGFQKQI